MITFSGENSHSCLVVAAKDQFACDLTAEEVVILDYKSGVYYGLTEVGARIWQLIQKPQKFADISAAIVEEYGVTPEVCDPDIVSLLEKMHTKGLIEVIDEASVEIAQP
ncbi:MULTISPECIES: PqqD family protein [Moorena]|uniref:Coenzyme PQQ synthesis protein D n=2 Tax=Moorena TaxID=1155738 RepID=F4XY60_9CYAN|nr:MULTISPECIES: PqqD family protein [Moorena]EGJ30457.1 hypothetical protein LYNGBM3L_50170 [Moorena producens 3L]NEP65885.1 PqqD family protein [Moorena sp. SIO3A5]NEQ10091.1 PqqD family protein [Moorena sp. SIO4E2]NER87373.1 PqqD family protein [Moorena sp. SIO3A2]OLT68647.1 hypothetical protein BI334_29805 [Moorena producens 3L]